ncbi:MAG TPA: carboxypeptidase-like regulatory domain-containing protein [Armatimonadota bacterium]|nr:carboxypeptidase-like regulatory domain-containing protein [Armatimonadota bacterium]
MTRPICVAVAVALLSVPIGCGGSGGGIAPPDPPNTTGEASGTITGVADPTAYTLTVDGRPVATRPGPNGDFVIRNLRPGPHTIGCIGPGGAEGGYVPINVEPGRRARIGRISPGVGGQIAGIVLKDDAGTLGPAEGVEVIASPAIFLAPAQGGGGSTPPMPPMRGDGGPIRMAISAFTDDGGAYAMKAVPPGMYDVSVIVPGYLPAVQFVHVAPGQTAAADFQLLTKPEGGIGTVSGTVVGDGAGPLAGAEITVSTNRPWPIPWPIPCGAGGGPCPMDASDPASPDYHPPWFEMDVFTTLTDSQGQYSLNVPTGTHFIEVWIDGYEWAGGDVTVRKDATTARDFQLAKWTAPPPPPPGPGPGPVPVPLTD